MLVNSGPIEPVPRERCQRCRNTWLVTLDDSRTSRKYGETRRSGTMIAVIAVRPYFAAFPRARCVSPSWHPRLRDTTNNSLLAADLVFI